jgi:MinD superfamily P-loop ATPase
MKIAVASGKGGTGKTTVTASLAHIWPNQLIAVDLDVEEPNLHLFLDPELANNQKAYIDIPVVDENACTYCRACAELCQFKAISILGSVALVFSEMCHGCGGCMAICPAQAISMGQRELGEISWGHAGSIKFIMGRLRVGEAMSPPLMRAVKTRLVEMLKKRPADVIIDAPPGVSCPAVNAVMDSDAILLVTEPTPFGLYDLELAYEAFSPLHIPMAVVINRSGTTDESVEQFCRERALPIIAKIPFDREIAQAYAQGRIIADLSHQFRHLFVELSQNIRQGIPVPKEADYA